MFEADRKRLDERCGYKRQSWVLLMIACAFQDRTLKREDDRCMSEEAARPLYQRKTNARNLMVEKDPLEDE